MESVLELAFEGHKRWSGGRGRALEADVVRGPAARGRSERGARGGGWVGNQTAKREGVCSLLTARNLLFYPPKNSNLGKKRSTQVSSFCWGNDLI